MPSPITLKKRLAAVELPTTPKGECDAALQKKVWRSRVAAACGLAPTATSQVQDFTEKKRRGLHFVDTLRAHKEFYNPSILETLVDQARSHSHANTQPNTNTNTSESYSRRHLPVLCACVCSWVNDTTGPCVRLLSARGYGRRTRSTKLGATTPSRYSTRTATTSRGSTMSSSVSSAGADL